VPVITYALSASLMLPLIPAIIFICMNYLMGRIVKDYYEGKSATMIMEKLIPLLMARIGNGKDPLTASDRQ